MGVAESISIASAVSLIYLPTLCCFVAGCSSGIYFKEVEDGIIIKPLGKPFLFFPSKLSSGKYEYSNGEKKASADFKKEPMKLLDINLSKIGK